MAPNDSAITAEQQISPGKAFAADWCKERRLNYDAEILKPSQFGIRAFKFINHDADGNRRLGLSTTRIDRKENKYISPKGKGSIIYAPRPDSMSQWKQADEVWLAEGEGKTLALAQLGLPVLGVRGCNSWHVKGSRDLHPVLAKLVQSGKRINIVFDADWKSNSRVHRGLYDCMAAIHELGGIPFAVNIPPIPGRNDTGIDDLIAVWRNSSMNDAAILQVIGQLEHLKEIEDPYIVNFREPEPTARNFIESVYGEGCLKHWQETFYVWQGKGWQILPLEVVNKHLTDFIKGAGFAAKRFHVGEIIFFARTIDQLQIAESPCWVDGTDINPKNILSCGNGLLNLSTKELLPHTPEYFNLSWSDVDYDPDATCPNWEKFLREIYPDDESARRALQEYIGYCLTMDTSQQKAIALIGPKRSGKGTVARTVQALLGKDSYGAATLQSMGERFGQQTWIGKKAVFISDARASIKNNSQAMVERVLTVTGEDIQVIDRKYKKAWTGRLNVRLWLISNQLTATHDTGAALVSRFLLLRHPVSFYGKEDTELEHKLSQELSGILNWALAGLHRLRERKYFEQPETGKELLEQWDRILSPLKAFVDDCCEIAPDAWVTKEQIRAAYRLWCCENNMVSNLDDSHFTNNLNSATEYAVKAGQKNVDGKKVRVFRGIELMAQPAQPKY